MKIIQLVYHNSFVEKVVPTLVSCLKRELKDCSSVLDIGCGPDSPLKHCLNIEYSVGVEPFDRYLKESKKKKIHSRYIKNVVQGLNYKENSFDAVILIDVIEHTTEADGLKLLNDARKWAKKKIIVTTPNGFVSQNAVDGNIFQKHLSGWTAKRMKSLGFECWGLAGLKLLRSEKDSDTMDDDLLVSIRFKPKPLWFMVSVISQVFTYRIPKLAFGLFCVKDLAKK